MHDSVRDSHRMPLSIILDILLADSSLVLLLWRASRRARQTISELIVLLLLLVYVVDVFR